MNILIVGCGKTGRSLAWTLTEDGHDVSVVDTEQENLKKLGLDFPGYTTLGIPIDQDVLRKAGIESCDALAAVCAQDNLNIMVGQIAKEIFGIQNVLVRVYDPKREAVYSALGLQTFCPTNLNATAAKDILTGQKESKSLRFGSHKISFYEMEAPKQVWNSDVSMIELSGNHFLFAVRHLGGGMTVCTGQKLTVQKGDTLVVGLLVD